MYVLFPFARLDDFINLLRSHFWLLPLGILHKERVVRQELLLLEEVGQHLPPVTPTSMTKCSTVLL